MRREAKPSLLVGTVILGFISIFKKCQASSPFEAFNCAGLLMSERMWGPLTRRAGDLGLSLGSPQGTQTSLQIVRWKKSVHLRHCREIRHSFESGYLGVHSTCGRKHRVPLTYILLRECSSWGACGKLAYLLSRRQGIILNLRRYEVHRTYLNLLYWNWWSSILEMGVSMNL